MISSAIYNLLTSDPNVSSIVSDRVLPSFNPDEPVKPQCIYEIKNTNSTTANDGPVGLVSCNVIITCLDPNKQQVTNLSLKVKDLLDGSKGTLPTGLDTTVKVQGIFWEDTTEDEDQLPETGQTI